MTLEPEGTGTLVASTEPWEAIDALDPETALRAEQVRRRRLLATAHPRARTGPAAELVLAADQFVVTPAGRVADTALIRATGDEARTIIAGYHWFTDWGRDTMIDLEGLTLLTGRFVEAGYILRTFAHYVRDGLIPNMFPEGTREGLYHTADASLWYFHAIDRYVRATGDRETLRLLLPTLVSIVDHHVRGHPVRHRRRPGGRPPAPGRRRVPAHVDGCQGRGLGGDAPARQGGRDQRALVQRAPAPRRVGARGAQGDDGAARLSTRADQVRAAFNARFWYAEGGYLYDVVDGETGRRSRLPAQSALRDLALPPGPGRGAVGIRPGGGPGAPGHAGGAPHPRSGPSGLQGDVRRRPPVSRRRLPPGHGLALAASAPSSTRGSGLTPRTARTPDSSWTASGPISTRRASGASARSSTRSLRSRPAGASRRAGAWPRCFAP